MSIEAEIGESELTVEVVTQNYVLSSQGMYTGHLIGDIPVWLNSTVNLAVESIVANDVTPRLDAYSTALESIEVGVNQSIVSMQSDVESINAIVTTVKSETEDGLAGMQETIDTKVDEDGATAVVNTLVGAKWLAENSAEAEAYINDVAATKVSDGFAENTTFLDIIAKVNDPDTGMVAIAGATDMLYTTVGVDEETGAMSTSGHLADLKAGIEGSLSASLITKEGVFVGAHEWDEEETLILGMIHTVVDADADDYGSIYQYFGGSYDEGYEEGWRKLDLTNASDMLLPGSTTTSTWDTEADGYAEPSNPKGGDIWVSSNEYYDEGNGIQYPKVRLYSSITRVWTTIDTLAEVRAKNITWAGGSSKLLRGPNGEITGWEFSDGSEVQSQFTIHADSFRVMNDGVATEPVFDVTDGVATFNGLVKFEDVKDEDGQGLADVLAPIGSTNRPPLSILINHEYGHAANGECTIFGYDYTTGEKTNKNMFIKIGGVNTEILTTVHKAMLVGAGGTFGYILYVKDKDMLKYISDGDEVVGDRHFWVVEHRPGVGWRYDQNSGPVIKDLFSDLSGVEGIDYYIVGDVQTGLIKDAEQLAQFIDGGGDDETKIGDIVGDWTTEANVYTDSPRMSDIANGYDIMEAKQYKDPLLETPLYKYSLAAEDWSIVRCDGECTGTLSDTDGMIVLYTDDSDDTDIWVETNRKFKYIPEMTYRINVKGFSTPASGVVYIGVVGYKADGVTRININGEDTPRDSHYIAASSMHVNDNVTFNVEGVFSGFGPYIGATDPTLRNSLQNPSGLHEGIDMFSIIVVTGYGEDSYNTTFITEATVEIVADSTVQYSIYDTPSLAVKINYSSYAGGNVGEAYIYGLDQYGNDIKSGSGGYVLFDNKRVYIDNQSIWTSKDRTGYILYNPTGTFEMEDDEDKQKAIVFAYPKELSNTYWYYDNNAGVGKSINIIDDYSHCLIIGEMKSHGEDGVVSASIWERAKSIGELTRYVNNYATGSTNIHGGAIHADSITTNKLKARAIVSPQFDDNVEGDIKEGHAGFRLNAEYVGTYDRPNIYGGYIRGGTVVGSIIGQVNEFGYVCADSMLVTNTSKTVTKDTKTHSSEFKLAIADTNSDRDSPAKALTKDGVVFTCSSNNLRRAGITAFDTYQVIGFAEYGNDDVYGSVKVSLYNGVHDHIITKTVDTDDGSYDNYWELPRLGIVLNLLALQSAATDTVYVVAAFGTTQACASDMEHESDSFYIKVETHIDHDDADHYHGGVTIVASNPIKM